MLLLPPPPKSAVRMHEHIQIKHPRDERQGLTSFTRLSGKRPEAEVPTAGRNVSQPATSTERVWTVKELDILNELCKPVVVVAASIYETPHMSVACMIFLAYMARPATNIAMYWQGTGIAEPA